MEHLGWIIAVTAGAVGILCIAFRAKDKN